MPEAGPDLHLLLEAAVPASEAVSRLQWGQQVGEPLVASAWQPHEYSTHFVSIFCNSLDSRNSWQYCNIGQIFIFIITGRILIVDNFLRRHRHKWFRSKMDSFSADRNILPESLLSPHPSLDILTDILDLVDIFLLMTLAFLTRDRRLLVWGSIAVCRGKWEYLHPVSALHQTRHVSNVW